MKKQSNILSVLAGAGSVMQNTVKNFRDQYKETELADSYVTREEFENLQRITLELQKQLNIILDKGESLK